MKKGHETRFWTNEGVRRLAAGEQLLGAFIVSGSPTMAEACGTLPIDWVLIDAEASSVDKADLQSCLRAIGCTKRLPFVRLPELNPHLIEHCLDLGYQGVLVPKIETAEQARLLRDYCLFPPAGRRGLNPVRVSTYFEDVPSYLAESNAAVISIAQVETLTGLNNIQEIAATPELGAIFIGPGDLALSLGHPGDVSHPTVEAAIARILEVTLRTGKVAGIFAYDDQKAKRYLEQGFQLVAIGNEIKLFKQGARAFLSSLAPRSS